MSIEISELDQMQSDYKAAVDEWVNAIRAEETLASADHTVAEVDLWEQGTSAKRLFAPRRRPRRKDMKLVCV
jgi:hypothetical protein